MTFPKELKEAISNLSSTEKDKLIFRLLKKDIRFANRLIFDLVSDMSVDDKRDETQKRLNQYIAISIKNFISPKQLLSDIRQMSGIVTEHVFTTLDKFGEVYLTIWMLNVTLKKLNDKLDHFPYFDVQKLYITILAKIFKVLILSNKLHEDYLYELRGEFDLMANYIGNHHNFMRTAMQHGLDINWLSSGNIPENIVEIHKKIRENGFLR